MYAGGSVETRTTMPHLGTFLLDAAGDNLRITSTDLAVAYTSIIPATVKTPGKIAVSAEMLNRLVPKLPDMDIKCHVGGNGWLIMVTGKNRTKIASLPWQQFPSFPDAGPIQVSLSSDLISKAFGKVMCAMGEAKQRPLYNCVNFKLAEAGVTMSSTNYQTIAYADFAADLEIENEFSFYLPRRGVAELKRLLGDFKDTQDVGIALSRNHVSFTWGNRIFTAQLIDDGKYPNMVRMPEFPNQAVVNAEVLRDALVRVGGFSDQISRRATLAFSEGRVLVTSSDGYNADAEEELEVEYSGEDTVIAFNSVWAIDFLKRVGGNNVTIRFNPSISEWLVDGDPGYRYYLALMVVKQNATNTQNA